MEKQFQTKRVILTKGPKPRVDWMFQCAACKDHDCVDEETGLCRPCWRVLILLAGALDDIRKGCGCPIPHVPITTCPLLEDGK